MIPGWSYRSKTTAATRAPHPRRFFFEPGTTGWPEECEDSPEGYPQTPPYQWWNYHDAYEDGA